MKGKIIDVTIDTIVGEVMNMKNDGQRLVTFSTYAAGEGKMGILYHFDKELENTHLRLIVDMDKPIPASRASTSPRCWWKTKYATSGTSSSTA